MKGNHEHNKDCACAAKNADQQNSENQLDVGAEEFSEQIYDEFAPVPEEFQESHKISNTGGELSE